MRGGMTAEGSEVAWDQDLEKWLGYEVPRRRGAVTAVRRQRRLIEIDCVCST